MVVIAGRPTAIDRHDVDPNAPDAVDEVDEATYDRHDTER